MSSCLFTPALHFSCVPWPLSFIVSLLPLLPKWSQFHPSNRITLTSIVKWCRAVSSCSVWYNMGLLAEKRTACVSRLADKKMGNTITANAPSTGRDSRRNMVCPKCLHSAESNLEMYLITPTSRKINRFPHRSVFSLWYCRPVCSKLLLHRSAMYAVPFRILRPHDYQKWMRKINFLTFLYIQNTFSINVFSKSPRVCYRVELIFLFCIWLIWLQNLL